MTIFSIVCGAEHTRTADPTSAAPEIVGSAALVELRLWRHAVPRFIDLRALEL
jgi:hypothetical protein